MKLVLFSSVLFLCSMRVAIAEYLVTSKVEGSFCSGWVIEFCKFKDIEAFSNSKNGQLFEFSESFGRVDEHSPKQDRCWLNNKRFGGYHAFARAVGDQWEYLGKPDYITFKCKKN